MVPMATMFDTLDLECIDLSAMSLTDLLITLDRIYRFNGHSNVTVLEHSWRAYKLAVKRSCTPAVQLAALTHDFHEAITGDISQPIVEVLERNVPGVSAALGQLKMTVDIRMAKHFEWPVYLPSLQRSAAVKEIDRLLLIEDIRTIDSHTGCRPDLLSDVENALAALLVKIKEVLVPIAVD